MYIVPIVLSAAIGALAFFGNRLRLKRKSIKAGKVIELSMVINEKDYTFVYTDGAPNANPKALAMRFCRENGENMGFTQKDMDQCVDPLSLELENAMRRQPEKKSSSAQETGLVAGDGQALSEEGIRRVPLEVNGVKYIFEYHIDMDPESAAMQLSREFCNAKGVELGIFVAGDTDGLENKCVMPHTGALKEELLTVE